MNQPVSVLVAGKWIRNIIAYTVKGDFAEFTARWTGGTTRRFRIALDSIDGYEYPSGL